jgi:hypothetical protein
MSVCLNRSSKSIHQYIRFVTVIQKREGGCGGGEKLDPSMGVSMAYKKTELKTFKAGRENIFGGICRTKPTQTGKRDRSPVATNDIHGFCIGWHHGKNPLNVDVWEPIQKGVQYRRNFPAETVQYRHAQISLLSNTERNTENRKQKIGSKRVSSAALPWIRSYVAAHLNRIKCT